MNLRWRRTKIIATIGPASDSVKNITALIKSGVNVFRLNMSHGDHDYHKKIFSRIRSCSNKTGTYGAILMDLCGPKIRVGKFEEGSIQLKKNDSVVVRCGSGIGRDGIIISQYQQLYKDVKKGERILLDDGNLECRVVSVNGKDVHCKVVYGGELKNNKGLNLPDTMISATSFTAKDKMDVKLAMELGADFVALSFVRTARDIKGLIKYMARVDKVIPVIAKIEKPEAVVNIDEIIKSSYGIMIARGDLGIELPAEEVPLIQKVVTDKARANNRPVIVATQMMESMITNARPTRAEVGDVANAAMTSVDAVMLSAETAAGKYPVKAVGMMDCILREIENHQWSSGSFGDDSGGNLDRPSSRRAIAHAANSLAHDLKLQGVLVPTDSGHTAAVLSASRPSSPLLGLSTSMETCQKLSLHWGIIPFLINKEESQNWKLLSQDICNRCKLTRAGNRVLLVSGFNDDELLNEPVMKIINVIN
ncbi:MAG: pyruvate kinase [Gammaproteobacteria bacterium]|nr:pyruvate kinase [Gammaproteobacteria bacterium]